MYLLMKRYQILRKNIKKLIKKLRNLFFYQIIKIIHLKKILIKNQIKLNQTSRKKNFFQM